MNPTSGTLLMWGGVVGLVLFAIAGVVCWGVLRKKRQRLLHMIQQDYQ